jgi:uncharacterized protein (UPF0218 family)/phosphopantetheine adenylyltransferase
MAFEKIRNSKLENRIKTSIQSFVDRKKSLENFLQMSGLNNRYEIVEINDVYGPSILKQSPIEALVVTSDTMKGAQIVNDKRKSLGLNPLAVVEVSLLKTEDQEKISSTKIREGEIDREGVVYKKLLSFDGKIPEVLRQKLKEPQGDLIKGNADDLMVAGEVLHGRVLPLIIPPASTPPPIVGVRAVGSLLSRHPTTDVIKTTPLIISIGDEVTKLCNELEIPVGIGIVDLHVNRKKRHSHIKDLKFNHGKWVHRRVINPAGAIKKSLVEAIYSSIHDYLLDAKRTVIEVEGEEDLAGLPAILMAPLGSIILYGQPAHIVTHSIVSGPGGGIVVVKVDEEVKQRLKKLFVLEK